MEISTNNVDMDTRALKVVEELFEAQIKNGVHPGASVAAYRYGNLVLDLYGGISDKTSGKPVTRDTIFVMYSCGKALAATCMHILWERGKFNLEDLVTKYWPEFGKNGKGLVSILHILTHRGGFPTTPASLPADEWSNWDAVVAAMENAELEYAPGQVLAYHPINYGWVIAELVRRIDGRPFSKFFHEELAAPLGMKDTYMGLPSDLEDRVSKVHSMEDAANGARGRLANIQDIVEIFNRPDIHQATIPAAGGIGTARDLARYYSMIVNGGTLDNVQILKADTVEKVTKLQVRDIDKTTGNYVNLGLGLALGDPRTGFSRTTNTRTVCHAGAGTSIAWGDLDSGLSVAIICNGFRSDQYNVARLAAFSQGIRNACL